VYSWNGTSVTCNVQSSPNGTDTWTTRISMTTQTSLASELKTWSTGTTNIFWRVSGTVVGTGCSLFAQIYVGSRTRGDAEGEEV
jgi:hypothetical protein